MSMATSFKGREPKGNTTRLDLYFSMAGKSMTNNMCIGGGRKKCK
jgi:hypothetical protein